MHEDGWRTSATVRWLGAGVMILALATGCSSADTDSDTSSTSTTTTTTQDGFTLAGTWQRTGGDFSVLRGMIVEVDEAVREGTISSVPRNPFQFKEGDVKWGDITEVSDGRFRIRDLVRQADTGVASHVTGVITPSSDGDMIELTFPSTGTYQVWTRSS